MNQKSHKSHINETYIMITTKTGLKDLLYRVNAAAIEVHKYLGPGLLESVYHWCLKHELNLRGIQFVSELQIQMQFKGESLEANLRCDFFIAGILIGEMKAIDLLLTHPWCTVTDLHEAPQCPRRGSLQFQCSKPLLWRSKKPGKWISTIRFLFSKAGSRPP